jgi:hypothetical protein
MGIGMGLLFLVSSVTPALADGTETLGPASITIESGTDVAAFGTGLVGGQPQNIVVTVPGGSTVSQALLYWGDRYPDGSAVDDTATVSIDSGPSQEVTGTLIGGPTPIADSPPGGTTYRSIAYRADITGLINSSGNTTVSVGGLDFGGTDGTDGAGIVVILDDGSAAGEIAVRDGSDYANSGLHPPTHPNNDPLGIYVPQTYTFPAADQDRDARMIVFGGDAQAGRTDTVRVLADGTEVLVELIDQLASSDGNEWDTLNIPLTVPAGATSITVEVESGSTGIGNPDSFNWIGSLLALEPPPLAALGDRVWEDVDADGIQDCIDGGANDPKFPADGIIGNAGDSGPECDTGIPDVMVNLFMPDAQGNCTISMGMSDDTDAGGFYLFDMLSPDDYCVKFVKPGADFCDTDGFDLGEPQFTAQNAGNDPAVDSDADAEGVSGSVSLAAGETDLSVDAGIFCPAKIGDRVWSDDNEDGLQDTGEEGIPDVIVKLFECTDGAPDVNNDKLVRITTTDGTVNEMNYMFGAEPDFALEPGEYFVQFMKPDGTEFTEPNAGIDPAVDSDCLPPNGFSSCVTLGSRGINLDRDCGLIPPPPPECDLELDKTCRVETPPVTGDLECEAKIAASVLEYTGPGTPSEVTVTGKDKKSQVVSSFKAGILTVDARPGDLGAKMTITTDGVAEVIHTSCSKPYVAGLPAPLDNRKGGPSANWLVLSFVDKNGGSASVPDDGNGGGMFTDNCTFTPGSAPSCATLKANKEKLSSLTFAYTGGGCPGDNDQGTNSSCSGNINPTEGVTVQAGEKVDNLNYPVQPMFVAPDGEFTIDPDKFKSNSALVASNAGGTETNEFHTSCSQPLAVGDVFGSFTLVAMNGQGGSTDVTYQYVVTNNGDPLTGVNVTDNVLGDIGGPVNLTTDESRTFTKSTMITGTTVNVAKASALLGGEVCSASDTTTVTVVEPPVTGGECDGKVTNLTLKNLGAGGRVRVEQKKDGTVFDDFVPAGGEFSFSGTDKKGTLGTEISIFVNGILNTKIHTSCSKPIGPGLVSGSFEVISGDSRNGGPLPPI